MVQCAERLSMTVDAERYKELLAKATRDAQRVQHDHVRYQYQSWHETECAE